MKKISGNPPSALLLLVIVVFIGIFFSFAPDTDVNEPTKESDELEKGFITPPDSLKPYVYWYWVSDNISKEGITKDLEAMARVGIGEAFIGNIGLDDLPYGNVKVLSEEWWQMVEFAIREGKRVGVDIGMFNSPGWSQSGGPWVRSSQAMRYLACTEYAVDEKEDVFRMATDGVEKQTLAILAFPLQEESSTDIRDLNPSVSGQGMAHPDLLFDKQMDRTAVLTSNPDSVTIDIRLDKEFTARSITIYPGSEPFSATVVFQVWEDGAYKTVKEFSFDRSNPSISVGPMPYSPLGIALESVTSQRFRLSIERVRRTGRHPLHVGFTEISVSSKPVLEEYAEKQLGKMHQTPFPLWKEYQWRNQPEAHGVKNVTTDEVIDLTKHVSPSGELRWKVPPGKWKVVNIELKPTGVKNSPSSPEGVGYEVDKINKQHVKDHFDAFIGKLLQRIPTDERSAFKHVVADSYEVGSQNWTDGFAQDFKDRYDYDPLPWLPTLTGTVVQTADQSNRFLWDLRRLVADKIAHEYVGGLRELSEKNGLRLWLENYGHWGFPSEFLMYGGQSHDIGGEFWVEGELGNIECKAASSAAHIYGKRKVFAESFTAAGQSFMRHPAVFKKRGDWSFTEGINHVLLHVYIHQAFNDRSPGMNAWFGTEFNRKNTWFEQSKWWIDYQRRCMFLLQQGLPVNDVCYFIGEDAPKMTGIREPQLPPGYDFDYINAEVLINRVRIVNGRIVLPDGMSYRMMILPPLKTMRPELATKLEQLVKEGMVIVGEPPERSPSLQNFPMADSIVRRVAAALWTDHRVDKHVVGKGIVYRAKDIQAVMKDISLAQDLHIPKTSSVLWTHRKAGDADIYFVTNQSDSTLHINPAFRVVGKQPELWDATNGKIVTLPQFVQNKNSTTVPITLHPAQSYFVVFRKSILSPGDGVNFPETKFVQTLANSWQIDFIDKQQGPKRPLTFVQLKDWSTSINDSIRYYSGTAIYRTNFRVKKRNRGERITLDLGDVMNMATVRVNGKLLGGIWTKPYQIEISDALVEGTNHLEIEVVNLWVNRLVGDSKLPAQKRTTWTTFPAYSSKDKLIPSGLIGPVTMISHQ